MKSHENVRTPQPTHTIPENIGKKIAKKKKLCCEYTGLLSVFLAPYKQLQKVSFYMVSACLPTCLPIYFEHKIQKPYLIHPSIPRPQNVICKYLLSANYMTITELGIRTYSCVIHALMYLFLIIFIKRKELKYQKFYSHCT